MTTGVARKIAHITPTPLPIYSHCQIFHALLEISRGTSDSKNTQFI